MLNSVEKLLSVDNSNIYLAESCVMNGADQNMVQDFKFVISSSHTAAPAQGCIVCITVNAADVPDLECWHEEADTHLLLHAAHAGQSSNMAVIIQSPDTDVAILVCVLKS